MDDHPPPPDPPVPDDPPAAPLDLLVGRSIDPKTSDFAARHRSRRLNCSEVAAVLHHDPWLSRVRVYQRKVGTFPNRRRAFSPPAARWGQAHEGEALRAYERATGIQPHPCGFVVHPSVSWLGGVPDGVTVDPLGRLRLVEVKCPVTSTARDAPPEHYIVQMQALMACCGAVACDYVEYRPHEPLLVRTVERSDEWFAGVLPTLERFWEDVVDARRRVVVVDDDPPAPKRLRLCPPGDGPLGGVLGAPLGGVLGAPLGDPSGQARARQPEPATPGVHNPDEV